jgi:hypothetical protein
VVNDLNDFLADPPGPITLAPLYQSSATPLLLIFDDVHMCDAQTLVSDHLQHVTPALCFPLMYVWSTQPTDHCTPYSWTKEGCVSVRGREGKPVKIGKTGKHEQVSSGIFSGQTRLDCNNDCCDINCSVTTVTAAATATPTGVRT